MLNDDNEPNILNGSNTSIAVGENADLVLVDGNLSRNIGDLRHTRLVMMHGKVMASDAGRPMFAE